MEIPIVLGRQAKTLSDVLDTGYDPFGKYQYWIIAGTSGEVLSSEEAYEMARELFPYLIDDEHT